MIMDWDIVPVRWSGEPVDGVLPKGFIQAEANIARAKFTSTTYGHVVVATQRFGIVNGQATLMLRATDDPDISPTGFTYTITEYIGNVRGDSYEITVPMASAPEGIDIGSLITPEASPGFSPGYPVTQQQLQDHINDPLPHPVYDDIPSLTLLFENRLV